MKHRLTSSISKNIDSIIHEQVQYQDPGIDKLFREELEKEVFHDDSKLNKDMREMAEAGVSHKPKKYKDPLQYSPQEFENFKHKLGIALNKNGLDCDDINKDPYFINFVKKYVENNFIDRKVENTLRRTTIKLAYTKLGHYSKDKMDQYRYFPIVQEYLGHFLIRVTYFAKEVDIFNIGTYTITAKTIPVKTASLILV